MKIIHMCTRIAFSTAARTAAIIWPQEVHMGQLDVLECFAGASVSW